MYPYFYRGVICAVMWDAAWISIKKKAVTIIGYMHCTWKIQGNRLCKHDCTIYWSVYHNPWLPCWGFKLVQVERPDLMNKEDTSNLMGWLPGTIKIVLYNMNELYGNVPSIFNQQSTSIINHQSRHNPLLLQPPIALCLEVMMIDDIQQK